MAWDLVLFDLDDTLCDYAGARDVRLRAAFGDAAAALPIATIDLDRMIAESIATHPHGTDHFPSLLGRYGLDDPAVATAAAAWYRANRFYGLALFPDALLTLRLARSYPGCTVGLITNGPAEVQRAKLELLALLTEVDFALISGEFGIAKPEPAIFAEALRIGRATPDRALFVGDSPEFDIAGARASGITAVWVNRTGQPWQGDSPPPEHEVTRLTALHPLLGDGGRGTGTTGDENRALVAIVVRRVEHAPGPRPPSPVPTVSTPIEAAPILASLMSQLPVSRVPASAPSPAKVDP